MDFSEIFKNVGELKTKMEETRKRVARMQITGEAGAGMVKITVNGEGQVQNVKIDRSVIGPNDNEMLEELIISAMNDATRRAREALAHEMKNVTGGLPIAGMEKLFGM